MGLTANCFFSHPKMKIINKPEQTIKFGAPYFKANPKWFGMVSAPSQQMSVVFNLFPQL
jgi:hypothetical protein